MHRPGLTTIVVWALAALSLGSAPPEIQYMGKPISHWINLLRNADASVRRETAANLTAIAPGADLVIPALGAATQDEDPEVRLEAVATLALLARNFVDAFDPLANTLASGGLDERLATLEALSEMTSFPLSPSQQIANVPFTACRAAVALVGEDDVDLRSEAIKALISILARSGESETACRAIADLAISARLDDEVGRVRRLAVRYLRRYPWGPQDPNPLLRALEDDDEMVRFEAALGLSLRHRQPGVTLAPLVMGLGSDVTADRRAAIEALRSCLAFMKDEVRYEQTLAEDREAGLSGLKLALKDEDRRVRMGGLLLAAALGTVASEAVAELINVLQSDPDHVLRDLAVKALGQIGPGAVEATPALIAACRAGSPEGSHVIDTLKLIDPAAIGSLDPPCRVPEPPPSPPPVQPLPRDLEALVETLRHGGPAAASRAVHALQRMGREAEAAVPALIEALIHGHSSIRSAVARVIGKLGAASLPAVPHLVDLLHGDEDEIHEYAAYALVLISRATVNPLPELLTAIEADDAGVQVGALKVIATIGTKATWAFPAVLEALQDDDPDVRLRAALALVSLRREWVAALPVLLDALRSMDDAAEQPAARGRVGPGFGAGRGSHQMGDYRHSVSIAPGVAPRGNKLEEILIALYKMPTDTPGLMEGYLDLLYHSNRHVRTSAAQGLSRLGSAASPAIGDLIQTLRDRDAQVRRVAVEALATLGPMAAEAVPILSELLFEDEMRVRAAAAAALGSFGPLAAGAVPWLMRAMKDPYASVRDGAAVALGAIGPDAAAALDLLLTDAMRRPFSGHHVSRYVTPHDGAAVGQVPLWSLGPIAVPAVPVLIEAMRNEGSRQGASRVLEQIGPDQKNAAPVLAEALSDPDLNMRRTIVRALGQIGPGASIAVPALIDLLELEEEREFRFEVVRALASIGIGTEEAIPAVVELLLQEKQKQGLRLSGRILWQFGPPAEAAVPILFAALGDPEKGLAASFVLMDIEPVTPRIADLLLEALRSPEENVRHTAARGLMNLGSAAYRLLPALIEMLSDPDPGLCAEVATVIGLFGSEARTAIPSLITLLSHDDEFVRIASARALGDIGPHARHAVPALIPALVDPSMHVGQAALKALRQIGWDPESEVESTSSDQEDRR